MNWIILVLLLCISWIGGRWSVKKYESDSRRLKRLERGNLFAICLVMLGCYVLMKFTDQTFKLDYYYLLIFLVNARLSLAIHRLFSSKIAEQIPEKEKESRQQGSIILILALGLMLIWLLIGFFSPGSLGTMPLPGQ